MNILLVNFTEGKQKELEEFLNTQGYKVYFADTDLEAVQILNNINISDVIVHLIKILNIGLINYINNHFSVYSCIIGDNIC